MDLSLCCLTLRYVCRVGSRRGWLACSVTFSNVRMLVRTYVRMYEPLFRKVGILRKEGGQNPMAVRTYVS